MNKPDVTPEVHISFRKRDIRYILDLDVLDRRRQYLGFVFSDLSRINISNLLLISKFMGILNGWGGPSMFWNSIGKKRIQSISWMVLYLVLLSVPSPIVFAQTPPESIPLSGGWNFISFPKDPPVKTPAAALTEVSSNVGIVWGYDTANRSWLKYKPGATSSLTVMESGKGYWIYMTGSGSISMTNWAAPQSSGGLYPGWNLIGYSGSDGAQVTVVTSTISDPWSIIWNWTAETWYAKHATLDLSPHTQPITNFYQGKAYWINVKGVGTGIWDSSLWGNCLWGL
jgi:hypothetical protein